MTIQSEKIPVAKATIWSTDCRIWCGEDGNGFVALSGNCNQREISKKSLMFLENLHLNMVPKESNNDHNLFN